MQHFQPTLGTAIGSVSFGPPPARDWQRDLVLHMVAKAHKVRKRLLLHPSRCMADTALARQTAMYLMHVVLGWGMSDVGAVFGRDRTTVRIIYLTYQPDKASDSADRPAQGGSLGNGRVVTVAQLDRMRWIVREWLGAEPLGGHSVPPSWIDQLLRDVLAVAETPTGEGVKVGAEALTPVASSRWTSSCI